MRRDVGGHPHGDPGGAVDQQVGQPRRQNRGLLQRPVEVGDEVHRVPFEIGQQLLGDMGETRLRVAHRRRRVVIHRAEVPLAVHQRVAQAEVLGQPHHRLVNGVVAVWVVLAQHLTDDPGALLVGGARAHPHIMHRVEDAALHRLETVTHVRQGARDDDRHSIVEVGGAHLLLDPDGADVSQRCSVYCHETACLLCSRRPLGLLIGWAGMKPMQLPTFSSYGTQHSVDRNACSTAALTLAMITHVARPFTPGSAP